MRLLMWLLIGLAALIILAALALAGMIWLSPDRTPAPMASIAAPFRQMNLADLPAREHLAAQEINEIVHAFGGAPLNAGPLNTMYAYFP